MPAKKKAPAQTAPAPLPMPTYSYQKPSTGSFSVKYEERTPAQGGHTLQNITFG
jgi:hypothetical protein